MQSGVTWAKGSSHEGVLGYHLTWALKELQDLYLPGGEKLFISRKEWGPNFRRKDRRCSNQHQTYLGHILAENCLPLLFPEF